MESMPICDCHMHFFDDRIPASPDATLFPANASVAEYQALMERLGIVRHVIVQPSTYGVDNSLLCANLSLLGDTARGVAVIDDGATIQDVLALREKGVVGTRLNLVQRSRITWGMLDGIARLAAEVGWHVQIHAPASELIARTRQLSRLPVEVVLDHLASFGREPGRITENIEGLLNLLANRKTWIKLSAPYIACGSTVHQISDLRAFQRKLVTAYPDRVVWGSDWPHVTSDPKPSIEDIEDELAFLRGMGSPGRQVLVENPDRLYQFNHRSSHI